MVTQRSRRVKHSSGTARRAPPRQGPGLFGDDCCRTHYRRRGRTDCSAGKTRAPRPKGSKGKLGCARESERSGSFLRQRCRQLIGVTPLSPHGPASISDVVHNRHAFVEEVPAATWTSHRIRPLEIRCHLRQATNSPGISYRSCNRNANVWPGGLLHRERLDERR